MLRLRLSGWFAAVHATPGGCLFYLEYVCGLAADGSPSS